MIEFYLFMIIVLIALMTLIISRYNRKQADALRDVASTAADWLITDILKHRQEKRKEIQIEDPLAWIEMKNIRIALTCPCFENLSPSRQLSLHVKQERLLLHQNLHPRCWKYCVLRVSVLLFHSL